MVGVEWGSSWPTVDEGSDGGGSSNGGDLEARYELHYTVADHLRRPWQMQRRDHAPLLYW